MIVLKLVRTAFVEFSYVVLLGLLGVVAFLISIFGFGAHPVRAADGVCPLTFLMMPLPPRTTL